MEALCVQPWEKDLVIREGEQVRKRRGLQEAGVEAPSPTGSATDEDTDSEPEPPPVPRRKVSFADAFGLNLVSVKEFDNAEAAESYENPPPGREVALSLEEFSVSCLFTVPSSPEELDQRLREHMVELESIELLPGTATVRGTVRVVNLCYTKSVHVRMSLDHWATHFDLLADYVPGSSDMRTDRFTFTYTLVPPPQVEGTRVELCLRYETPLGTFWANNKGMNYVLLCYKKVPVNGAQGQEEGKGKRSCLRPSRRPSAEGVPTQPGDTLTGFTEAAQKAESERESRRKAELQSLSYQKSLVEAVKSRRRETRLALVQDFMTQRRSPKARSQRADEPLQSTWGVSGGLLGRGQESPRVLTYHEIPLLTLDWTGAKACTWGDAPAGDLWAGGTSASRGGGGGASAPRDLSNGAGRASDTKASVCDVWQAFLTGSACGDHSGVSESEWLQTATSVSPSDDPRTPRGRVGAPNTRSCQLPAVALEGAGGTRAGSPADDRSKHVSDESRKILHEQGRGGGAERMPEQSLTLTADLEAEGSESERSRTAGGVSRPGETSTEETRTGLSRAGRLKLSPAGSEGSEDAASGNLMVLNDRGVETPAGTSPETARLTGGGLEIGEQQQAGRDPQTHRGEHNRAAEPAPKPEEEEEEKQQEQEEEEKEEQGDSHVKEEVGLGEQGSVLTSEGRIKGLEDNSGTHTSQRVEPRTSEEVPRDDGETVTPVPDKDSTAGLGETRWLLFQDAAESQEDKSNKRTKERDTQRPATSGRMEGDVNLRAEIEEQREPRAQAGVPQGEETTPGRAEAGELSAGAESSSCAENEGRWDTEALRVTESELKKAIIRRFGEDLVRAIWEEVFRTPKSDFSGDGRADTAKAVSPAEEFGSGVNSSADPRLSRSLEGPLLQDGGQGLLSTGPRVHSAPQEPGPQMAEEQEGAGPREAPSPEEVQEPGSLVWWSVFYVLSHMTRLPVVSGAVVGLFLYFFLCDFPAFFVVYVVSLCCWFFCTLAPFSCWHLQQSGQIPVVAESGWGGTLHRALRGGTVTFMSNLRADVPAKSCNRF